MSFSSAFDKYFPLIDPKSKIEIIWWWEKKRPVYNLLMLFFGSITLVIGYLCFGIPQNFPWPGLIIFALSANIFYTSGWIAEIVVRKYLNDQVRNKRIGQIIFLAGCVFSVFLTFAVDTAFVVAFFSTSVVHH